MSLRTAFATRSTARPLASVPSVNRPRSVSVNAQASRSTDASNDIIEARRNVLLGMSSVALASVLPAFQAQAAEQAVEEGFKGFYGNASPPTSYGGYGGNAIEAPKYYFEYPSTWKAEQPSKVDKGTKGIDINVINKKGKERAFVITLTRAGEDDQTFKLTDIDSTFAGFAGADYNLLDAYSMANEITKGERTIDGVPFFTYDIESPDFCYLSSIAIKNGKVYALFVKSPTKSFKTNEVQFRHIVDTFKLL